MFDKAHEEIRENSSARNVFIPNGESIKGGEHIAEQSLTSRDIEEFETRGYLVISGAVEESTLETLNEIIERQASSRANKIQNHVDPFALDPAFLELVDLPTVLPKVSQLLGQNIWINHSHFNHTPPTKDRSDWEYGWHRDGGAINDDLPFPAPRLVLKVGFYLTDLSKPDRGQTLVLPGSHRVDDDLPATREFPDTAIPILAKGGDAVLFNFRLVHSLRSPNPSTFSRNAVFLMYAFRWIQPVSQLTLANLPRRCTPIQRQLLGLTTTSPELAGRAGGRSGRFYPSAADLPLRHGPPRRVSLVRRAKRILRGLRG